VLSPWQSPINYAPRNLAALKDELAARAAAPLPALRRALRSALDVGAVWHVTRAALERIDSRPGRLYSFVAQP
jgi:hypothetical protein